ncbi:MAG: protein kinase [Pirellulaceae bacterium]|nr:protein kinase [Pirellulaceae bacterium]
MSTCPCCNAKLSENDALAGFCPSCRFELPAEWLANFPFALKHAAVASTTAPPEAAPTVSPDVAAPAADPADKAAMLPDDLGDPPPAEQSRNTAESVPPQSATIEPPPGGPVPPLDSDEAVAQRVVTLWQGHIGPDVLSTTSLKTGWGTVEARTNVVVQPRVVQQGSRPQGQQPDYEVLDVLGQGGMGLVSAARQTSINRTVAVKVLRPDKMADLQSRQKFLSEAVVTGELEHPNIVPIYDLGKDQNGALFYSMKRVKGRPWDTNLRRKSLAENLEILMKVADAVAFAHSRGVLHRDLKPENVMLGDFGEVMLMDWGLALSVAEASSIANVAGTPAYMAPEMAMGESAKIGIASDVYLLGAILYDIVTGSPPHGGRTVMECLTAAARNEVAVPEEPSELLQIALRAMETRPEDRYQSVGEFQAAIRDYDAHSESIRLSERAEQGLEQASKEDDYQFYARALFGFQEALALWSGNHSARDGVVEASLAYASSALRKGDFDLAATLLDPKEPSHAPVLGQVRAGQHERESRQKRLQAAKRLAGLLVLAVVIVVGVAFVWISNERDRALVAEKDAIEKREDAIKAQQRADEAAEGQRLAAEAARAAEVEQRKERKKAEDSAEAARQAEATARQAEAAEARQREHAEQEAYVARIGLAAAKIEENAFQRARELLAECPPDLRDWEWGRLMYLCRQHVREIDTRQPIETVAFSPDGRRFVTGGWDGTLRIWDTDTGELQSTIATGGRYVFAAAFSPDGHHLAVGTNHSPDYLMIFDLQTGQPVGVPLRGHGDAVLSVVYSRDGKRLLTGSYDNTARLWDLASGESRVFRGHDWWVWSATFSPDEQRILTASQDGSALVWSVETGKPQTPFLEHGGPVYGGEFAPDGRSVATAGYDGRILLWDPDRLRPFDFAVLTTDQVNPAPPYEALLGHTAAVRTVHFDREGRLLVSSANDNTVRVWDVADRSPLKTLRGHGGRVPACALAPDDMFILSGSHDHRAMLWSLERYEELRIFRSRVFSGHRDAVLGAGFSSDGKLIVSASRDRTARIWDTASGRELRQLNEGHEFLVSACRFFPDGKRILTAAIDNTVRVWDVVSGSQHLILNATGFSAAVAVSDDGGRILTGASRQPTVDGDDSQLWSAQWWDAATGQLIRRLDGHAGEVTAVAIAPGSGTLFTGDAKGQCRLWDAESGELRWQVSGHSRPVAAAAFAADGQQVFTASPDNTVIGWNAANGQATSVLLKHPDAVTALVLSPDNRYALTACADRAARLWDIAGNREIGQVRMGDAVIHAIAFSPDGSRVAVMAGDGTVQVWNADRIGQRNGDGSEPEQTLRMNPDQAWSLAFSPDGLLLLTAGGDEAILWNLKTGQSGMRFARQGSVASAQFSRDGRWIATGSWDTTAKIWDAEQGLVRRRLVGHDGFVNDVVFSPKGDRVATASDDRTAALWDIETGQELVRLTGHQDRIRSVAFSPDGQRVVTASNDKTARIWDTETGHPLHVLTAHDQGVLCAAYSPDGRWVITGGEDNQALVWDVVGDRPAVIARLQGHSAAVTAVAVSPSGTRVVTVSQDHTAIVWDPRQTTESAGGPKGTEILTLKGHTGEVTTVSFSPDGRSVLTGSQDGTLILWSTADWHGPQAPADSP